MFYPCPQTAFQAGSVMKPQRVPLWRPDHHILAACTCTVASMEIWEKDDLNSSKSQKKSQGNRCQMIFDQLFKICDHQIKINFMKNTSTVMVAKTEFINKSLQISKLSVV